MRVNREKNDVTSSSKDVPKLNWKIYYNSIKYFVGELKLGLIEFTTLIFTLLKVFSNNLTFSMIFKCLSLILVISKIMSLPEMCQIVGPILSDLSTSVVGLYAEFYSEVLNRATSIKNLLIKLYELHLENQQLNDRLELAQKAIEDLVEENQKMDNLNNELHKKNATTFEKLNAQIKVFYTTCKPCVMFVVSVAVVMVFRQVN